VLRHLLADGPQSRASLAARTGLMRSTVSSLVAQLEELGLVERAGRATGRVGRPGELIAPRPDGGTAVGAELAVDRARACLVDLAGELRARFEERFPRGDGAAGLVALDRVVARALAAAA